MAVLDGGDAVPHSTGAALDFDLAKILGLAELVQSLSDMHRSLPLLRWRDLNRHVLPVQTMGILFVAEVVWW